MTAFEQTNDMPRGQWMATEGRQIYHEWLAGVIDARRSEPFIYNDLDFLVASTNKSKQENHRRMVQHNLLHFADNMSRHIMQGESFVTENKDETSKLTRSLDKIMVYTSADEWLRGNGADSPLRAVHSHTDDGISFATTVTAGLAYEAYCATYNSVNNAEYLYRGLTEIMHDASFQKALEQFSATGFAVLANNAAYAMLSSKTNKSFSDILGYDESHPLMMGEVNNEGLHNYNLNPIVIERLVATLNLQNKDHLLNRATHSITIVRHLAKRSFTSGCPVRKAPDPTAKSGIALLSDYMGERLSEVARAKFSNHRLATTALDAAMQS